VKILISNDDGVHALGIKTLNDELKIKYNTTVIAPEVERSGCGQSITLDTPIIIKEVVENIYQCNGYPADCIAIGMGHIFKANKPDLIVSGINHGANLGQDRFYSGTVGAAREGTFRDIPSIAVSLVLDPRKGDEVRYFDTAAKFIKKIIDAGVHEHIPRWHLLNINIPNKPWEKIAGIQSTFVGVQKYSDEIIERSDVRGRPYYWLGGQYLGSEDIPGSDCNAVAEGFISLNLQDQHGKNISHPDFEEIVNNLK